MKKLIAALLSLSMLAAMSTTALAAEIDQDDDPQALDAVITTSIAPTYTVTIPADTTVPFNAQQTSFGTIEVASAQIEPNKQIKVSLETDGALINQADNTKTIPYTVNDENGVFSSAVYAKAGDKTDLTIHITQDDWNKAYAGSYSDTVTFTVSYESMN